MTELDNLKFRLLHYVAVRLCVILEIMPRISIDWELGGTIFSKERRYTARHKGNEMNEENIVEEKSKLIYEALSGLGDDVIAAKAYVLEYDDEVKDYIAYAIFVVKSGSVEEHLSQLTEKCQLINQALDGVVAFVHCVYRNSAEYEDDFGNEVWSERLAHVSAA